MTKREALEKCMDQWQRIHTELIKMDAAAADGELFQIPTLNQLKRKALRDAGVSDGDYPLNACYLCEYVHTQHPTPHTEPLACEYCPLKGYAWEQCEMDGAYLACNDAYDEERFGDAADYALEISNACERALEAPISHSVTTTMKNISKMQPAMRLKLVMRVNAPWRI